MSYNRTHLFLLILLVLSTGCVIVWIATSKGQLANIPAFPPPSGCEGVLYKGVDLVRSEFELSNDLPPSFVLKTDDGITSSITYQIVYQKLNNAAFEICVKMNDADGLTSDSLSNCCRREEYVIFNERILAKDAYSTSGSSPSQTSGISNKIY